MIKKLLAVIISVSLIMTSFSATAFAETVSDKESFPEGISDTAGITENEDLSGAGFSLENSPGENSAQDVPVAETPAELTAVQSTPEGTALSGDIGDY